MPIAAVAFEFARARLRDMGGCAVRPDLYRAVDPGHRTVTTGSAPLLPHDRLGVPPAERRRAVRSRWLLSADVILDVILCVMLERITLPTRVGDAGTI